MHDETTRRSMDATERAPAGAHGSTREACREVRGTAPDRIVFFDVLALRAPARSANEGQRRTSTHSKGEDS